ncbi:DUF185-domain-containing protein, partial [Hyphopichia burtonii NRRL Y-1933]
MIHVLRQGRLPNTQCVLLVQSRSLFKNFKKIVKKIDFEEKDTKHHEYSIRPDTFAFKVSAANEKNRSLLQHSNPDKPVAPIPKHPLQKDSNTEFNNFNLVDFVYKNSTNYPFENKTPQEVFNTYPSTNSAKLARFKTRPKKSKMLVSDFIEDSLYNPHYGYFSREVEIFHPDKPFDYQNIADVDDFMENWKQAYSKYDEGNLKNQEPKEKFQASQEENVDKIKSKFARHAKKIQKDDLIATKSHSGNTNRRSLQLWHTPTELFQPYYGESLARYILVNYKLNGNYPYNDLIIYEMGGGNGTLMCNILNFIKENEPDIYLRTQYKIIEISSQLAMKQFKSAMSSKLVEQGLDELKLEIINKSIFNWDKIVEDPCFFIALEVFDNFSHDLIRYDNATGLPHQGHVLIDDQGDFYEFFTPELSYYSNAFLQLRENGQYPILRNSSSWLNKLQTYKSLIPFIDKSDIHPLNYSSSKLKWQNSLVPFKDDLTPGEFIPTRLLQFFQILKHRFPHHSLICSDFNTLPKTIGDNYYNAPVVQTVIQDRMVDVSTYMCHQGYFDIMFPTDFELASDLYKQVTGKVSRVESHHDFLDQWADLEMTTTKKNENPMLDFYRNVSFMVS